MPRGVEVLRTSARCCPARRARCRSCRRRSWRAPWRSRPARRRARRLRAARTCRARRASPNMCRVTNGSSTRRARSGTPREPGPRWLVMRCVLPSRRSRRRRGRDAGAERPRQVEAMQVDDVEAGFARWPARSPGWAGSAARQRRRAKFCPRRTQVPAGAATCSANTNRPPGRSTRRTWRAPRPVGHRTQNERADDRVDTGVGQLELLGSAGQHLRAQAESGGFGAGLVARDRCWARCQASGRLGGSTAGCRRRRGPARAPCRDAREVLARARSPARGDVGARR